LNCLVQYQSFTLAGVVYRTVAGVSTKYAGAEVVYSGPGTSTTKTSLGGTSTRGVYVVTVYETTATYTLTATITDTNGVKKSSSINVNGVSASVTTGLNIYVTF